MNLSIVAVLWFGGNYVNNELLDQGKTTFIIAYRLSIIISADKILALKDGEIVESRTHNELLAKDGFY